MLWLLVAAAGAARAVGDARGRAALLSAPPSFHVLLSEGRARADECLRSLPRVYPSMNQGFLNGLERSVAVEAELHCGDGWGCCVFDDAGCSDTAPGTGQEAEVCCYAHERTTTVTHEGPFGTVTETIPSGCYVKKFAKADANPENGHMRYFFPDGGTLALGFEVDELNIVTKVVEGSVAYWGWNSTSKLPNTVHPGKSGLGLEKGMRIVRADIADLGTHCCPWDPKNPRATPSPPMATAGAGSTLEKCATLDTLLKPIPEASQRLGPKARMPGVGDWGIAKVQGGIQTALHVEIAPCASCIDALPMVDTFLDQCARSLDLGPNCRTCLHTLPHLGIDCQNCHQTGRQCDACMVHLFNLTD
eukprot:gene45728-31753_t